MEAGRFSRALTCSVVEGALATVMGTLLGGVFLTAFALHLGASRVQIGLLAASTSLAQVAQLGGALLIERIGRRKAICMVSSWASRLMWVAILLVPFLTAAATPQQRVWCIVALLTVSSLMASIGGVAWLSWIKDLVPQDVRLRFLGRRHLFNTALAFSMSVAGGLFLDWRLRCEPDSLTGFVLVFLTAMACGIVGLFILQTMPDVPHQRVASEVPLEQFLSRPLADTNFRRLIAFYSVWNFASNLATPFFAVYMLQVVEISFAAVTLLLTLSSMVGLAATRFWTRFGDRFGTRNMVLVATLADAFCPLCWLLVTPANLWILLPIHCFGICAAPLALGPSALSLKLSPAQNGAGHLALFNAVTGPITAAGAIVGGSMATWASNGGTAGAMAGASGLHVVFVLSAMGRLVSLRRCCAASSSRSRNLCGASFAYFTALGGVGPTTGGNRCSLICTSLAAAPPEVVTSFASPRRRCVPTSRCLPTRWE